MPLLFIDAFLGGSTHTLLLVWCEHYTYTRRHTYTFYSNSTSPFWYKEALPFWFLSLHNLFIVPSHTSTGGSVVENSFSQQDELCTLSYGLWLVLLLLFIFLVLSYTLHVAPSALSF